MFSSFSLFHPKYHKYLIFNPVYYQHKVHHQPIENIVKKFVKFKLLKKIKVIKKYKRGLKPQIKGSIKEK